MPLFNPPAAPGGSGTVTSVGLSASGLLHTVSGSPVTTSGTLALTLKTQAANALLAGPISGADAAPTMRALDPLDVPALDAAKIASGTFADARLASGITGSKISGALSSATLATSALTGTIAAAQLAVSSPTSGQVGGLATGNLSASAGLVAGQIASVNPSALTGSGTVPLAGLSGLTTSQLAAGAGILGSQLDAAAAIASGQITSLATSKLTGTISASQLAVSAPTSGQLGGLTTSNLSASAAITSGQIASCSAATITGTNTLPDSVLSTNVPLLASNNTFTTAGSSLSSGTVAFFSITPTLTQSSTAGYTALLVNATHTSVGSGTKLLADLQVAAASKFKVDSTGLATIVSGVRAPSYLGASFQAAVSIGEAGGSAVTVASRLKLLTGSNVTSGSGVPTTPGSVNPTAGDVYFRTDGAATALLNIYYCTVGGASPTWVGIA